MKYVLEEMTQEIWGSVYGSLVERLLQDHGAVEISEDEYGCIVDVRPYKEPVDIHALWDLHDCNSLAEPARSELWDAISSLQRANFTEDEIVYQIESFMGKV